MQELLQHALATAHGMWRWRWVGAGVAWAVGIAGVILVSGYPDRYEARARVYVDTQTILKPLMSGLAVEPDVNQMVNMVARTLVSRPTVEKLLRDPALGFASDTPQQLEQTVDRLMRNISLSGSGRDNLFDIRYQDSDPRRSLKVVKSFVDTFMAAGAGGKQRDTQDAIKFIDEQIVAHEQRLREAEARLKEFKLRNFGYIGGSDKDAFTRMSLVQEDLTKLRAELRAAEQSRDSLRRELSGEEPILLPEPALSQESNAIPELDVRLDALSKQLDDLMRRFTEEHPDVVGIRRQIAQLEAQKKQEIEARQRAAAARNKGKMPVATNPVYQQIKISLAESEARVASLQARVNDLGGRLEQLRSTATRFPQLEAELAQLNRDYDIVHKNYESLVSRREAAKISQDVDAKAAIAEFRVVDPPYVNPRPVLPNRVALGALALFAALAIGVATTFALSRILEAVHDTKVLRAVAGRPVLGAISLYPTSAQLRRARLSRVGFGGALAGLIGLYGVWIAILALRSVAQVT